MFYIKISHFNIGHWPVIRLICAQSDFQFPNKSGYYQYFL